MLPPDANDPRCDPGPEIPIEADRELRLGGVALDNARNRRQARERRVDQVVAETTRMRLIDQSLQPLLEGTRGRFRRRWWCLLRQQKRRQEQSSQSHANRAE